MLNNFRKLHGFFAIMFLIVWAHFALAEDELCNVTPAQVTQAASRVHKRSVMHQNVLIVIDSAILKVEWAE